jgi:hypothetical protein
MLAAPATGDLPDEALPRNAEAERATQSGELAEVGEAIAYVRAAQEGKGGAWKPRAARNRLRRLYR